MGGVLISVSYNFITYQSNMLEHCDIDLLYPSPKVERKKHKLKRLVQTPNSYFMDVKCPACSRITNIFSHSQRVVSCLSCGLVLGTPAGGKSRLTAKVYIRKKV